METLERRYDLFAIVIVFILAMIMEFQESFSLVEDETLSYRQILRTVMADADTTAPSEDVVIVFTDEDFYTEYDAYPLRRVDLSTLLANLNTMGASVIAVDMLLDFNSAYGEDPVLENVFRETGNVLLVSQAEFDDRDDFVKVNTAIDRFADITADGYSNISANSAISESIVRLKLYPEIVEEADTWPFAVKAVSMFLDEEPVLDGNRLNIGDEISIQLDQFRDLYIDWPLLPPNRNGDGGQEKLHDLIGVSAAEILFAADEEELEELSFLVRDKIVLIGEVAEVAHDEFETPVGNVYGVEIIANTISTLLKNGPLHPASTSVELIINLLLMLGFMATVLVQNATPRNLLSFGIVASFIGVAFGAYIYTGLVISMSYALMASLFAIIIVNTRFYLVEMGKKQQIQAMFGQYLSPTVVENLVSDPSKLALGGEEREMTAYFSDIQGFSSFSERMTPSELVATLNDYLTEMCGILVSYEGTIDKFEGDAIIAFWGAPAIQPDHAKLCCFASIDMNKALVPLRQRYIDEGWPELYVRMGINTGTMLVGNMGSAQRMDYTMMGDPVNLASRLEGANKVYGSDLMIAQNTYDRVSGDVDVRELDTIRVVGKSRATTVYQLLDRKNQTDAKLSDMVVQFESALKIYKERNFVDAMAAFRLCQDIIPADGPSRTYIERCQNYIDVPPGNDWDGVFTLTDKG